MSKISSFVLTILCFVSLLSCADQALLPRDLAYVWKADTFRYATIQAYDTATQLLKQQLPSYTGKNWAVFVDIDDTILSNRTIWTLIALGKETNSDETYTNYHRHAAMPAIDGAIEFLKFVRLKGGTIILCTNRPAIERPFTLENLQNQGVPFDALYLLEKDAQNDFTHDSTKHLRREAVTKGTLNDINGKPLPAMTSLLYIGDQITDLYDPTNPANTFDAMKEHFKTDFVVIPNPMYGLWMQHGVFVPREVSRSELDSNTPPVTQDLNQILAN
ncbi:MAG: HAD family acid phosphatase [Myxococcaceae bacterium]